MSKKKTIEVSEEEYKYLVWFRRNADFGPASGDVVQYMHEDYEAETGCKIPKRWDNAEDYEDDEEDDI